MGVDLIAIDWVGAGSWAYGRGIVFRPMKITGHEFLMLVECEDENGVLPFGAIDGGSSLDVRGRQECCIQSPGPQDKSVCMESQ